MPPTATPVAVEPLFASNARLWLRVWGATQAAAVVIGTFRTIAADGGLRPFLFSPGASRVVLIIAALSAYHAFGLAVYHWLIGQRWAAIAFVPLGWIIIGASLGIGGQFGLLLFGAIIQAFVFWPFAWAMTALWGIVLAVMTVLVTQSGAVDLGITVTRLAGLLATGVAVGTVMAYIHHVNRHSAARARLLLRLDEAQRNLADRAREAGVQQERQRLALDIHDTLAQGFAGVIRHLEAVELSLRAGAASETLLQRATPHLTHAQALSRSSLAEIRRVVWALRPPQLADATLPAALQRLVAHWSEANNVPATWTAGPLPTLLPDADTIFLRAAQEALSNVARHAHASKVAVSLQCVDGLVLLSVDDDGRGIANPDSAGEGAVGISGMRERVRRFGGHVLIEGARGGTSITVAVPLASIVAPEQ